MPNVGIRKATTPELSKVDERGAVAVMVAIIASLLIVCLAFAIDLGYAWQVKRAMVKSTDAAALAAAQAATGIENLSVRGPCPTSVDTQAVTFLNANTTGASLEFCRMTGTKTGASNASQSSGIVTVRAMQTANFSFSRLFGLNSTDIYSSTSARWNNAPLLPFVACANKGNSSSTNNKTVSDWYDDPSPGRAPITITSNWEGTDTSTLCSNGSSGGYGMIDFASSPTSSSDFAKCNSSNPTYQNALATNIASWIGGGYPGTVADGALRCAKVGQPYGSAVNKAICQARGKEVAVPLIGSDPNAKNTGQGTGKDWIVEISGFALVTINDYTNGSNQNLCDSLAAPASRRENRHLRLASARKSLACSANSCSVDLGVSEASAWPTSIEVNTPTVITAAFTNFSDQYTMTDATLNFDIGSTARPSVNIPSGCTETTGPLTLTVRFNCPAGDLAPLGGGTKSVTFSGTITSPITVNVKITSSTVKDKVTENNSITKNISVIFTPTTSTSTTTTTTTAPPTTTSTTVVPSGDFTRLVMTFLRTATDGSACCNALNRLYSYRICAVNISTAAAALSPAGCSDDNSGIALNSQVRATEPFDLAAYRSPQNHNKRRADIRVTKNNIRDRRAERILP